MLEVVVNHFKEGGPKHKFKYGALKYGTILQNYNVVIT